MKVCVLGLGYVGLPTAAVLSNFNHQVLGVDINSKVVDTINKGNVHIHEPDLADMIKNSVRDKKLRASMTPEEADVFLIVVPTPLTKDKDPDMKFVNQVVYSVSPHLTEDSLLILESTSPVGSTEKILEDIKRFRPDLFSLSKPLFKLAHCPERVLPGNVIVELVENDRVVGGINEESTTAAADFYKTFVKGSIFETDCKTAEMTKLVENSFRDVNIAFANELSIICNNLDINVRELISLANKHPRVNILNPGVGVGGHCIAVDPWFVVSQNKDEARMIKTARQVNDHKTTWVVERVLECLSGCNSKASVGVLGLSYKQDIDDTRESPGVKIAEKLIEKIGSDNVLCCEPHLKEGFENLSLFSQDYLIKKCDVLLFCVPHSCFKEISKEKIKNKIVLDYCGVFEDL